MILFFVNLLFMLLFLIFFSLSTKYAPSWHTALEQCCMDIETTLLQHCCQQHLTLIPQYAYSRYAFLIKKNQHQVEKPKSIFMIILLTIHVCFFLDTDDVIERFNITVSNHWNIHCVLYLEINKKKSRRKIREKNRK